MHLDSDVPNADAHLYVEFYKSRADGYEGVPFVRIMNPGDKTNVFDQPVKEEHKARFPRHWLHFQMSEQGLETGPIGTALELWRDAEPQVLSENQMLELNIMKFQTVEQIAMASDAQLQRIGMGGLALRERARGFLARHTAAVGNAELAETKAELAGLKDQMAQMLALMQAQQAQGPQEHAAETPAPTTTRRKKETADGLVDADAGNADHG
jgi:hypothetical protein